MDMKSELGIKACWKHPNFDPSTDKIPTDKNGEDCFICIGAKRILEEKNKRIKQTKKDLAKPKSNPNIDIQNELKNKMESGETMPKCYLHTLYRGLRKPRNNCESCLAVYNTRRQLGIKETRKRKT